MVGCSWAKNCVNLHTANFDEEYELIPGAVPWDAVEITLMIVVGADGVSPVCFRKAFVAMNRPFTLISCVPG